MWQRYNFSRLYRLYDIIQRTNLKQKQPIAVRVYCYYGWSVLWYNDIMENCNQYRKLSWQNANKDTLIQIIFPW